MHETRQSEQGIEQAILLLEAEHYRQICLRDDRFGDGDGAGSFAAAEMALHYRAAVLFLRAQLQRRELVAIRPAVANIG